MPRQYNGRPKGSTTKRCLIKDELIKPFEIHIDESNHQFLLVDSQTQNVEGYYSQITYAIKAILKKRCVPNNGETYTLKGYVKEMSKVRDDMMDLLVPEYHNVPTTLH